MGEQIVILAQFQPLSKRETKQQQGASTTTAD